MEWLQFCYCSLCGYSKEEFLDATFSEIISQIRNYKKFNTPPDKKNKYNNNKNQSQTTTKTETFSYGVDPETVKRWQREEEG